MQQTRKKQWMALSLACCALLSACGKQRRLQNRPQMSSAEMEIVPFTPAPVPAQLNDAEAAPKAADVGISVSTLTETKTETAVETKTETTTETQVRTATKTATRTETAIQTEVRTETKTVTATTKAVIPAPALSVQLAPAPQVQDTDEAQKLGEVTPKTPFSPYALLRMPDFQAYWGLREDIYEKVKSFYGENRHKIHNPDYVVIVDFSKASSEKRFVIFDLRKSRIIKLLTTHGRNSDPLNTGLATQFSNSEDSLQSSLGFFLTLQSYDGTNGYSLRIRGLEATNSNAEKRGVVIHSAPYVDEEKGYAGRSWGCLALDPKISRTVIDHIRGGALLYIGK